MLFDSVSRKIEDHLRVESGCFCDSCIGRLTGVDAADVKRVARRLGTGPRSSRYKGRCSTCNRLTAVTTVNSSSI
jgi:hypothetical protein